MFVLNRLEIINMTTPFQFKLYLQVDPQNNYKFWQTPQAYSKSDYLTHA